MRKLPFFFTFFFLIILCFGAVYYHEELFGKKKEFQLLEISQINALSKELTEVPPLVFSRLEPYSIQFLLPSVLNRMNLPQFNAIQKFLSLKQIALLDKRHALWLTGEAFGKFDSEEIKQIPAQIISSIKPDQIPAFENKLSFSDLLKLNPGQIQSLSIRYLERLFPDEITALPAGFITSLSKEQLPSLSRFFTGEQLISLPATIQNTRSLADNRIESLPDY